MSNLTDNRLKLLANGYVILPSHGKVCRIWDWGRPRFVAKELTDNNKRTAAERVAKWPSIFRDTMSTCVRLDDRLTALDNDCDDGELAGFFWDAVERHAPELLAKAPARFGGGKHAEKHKVALFVRLDAADEGFGRLCSNAYARPEPYAAWQAAMATWSALPKDASRGPKPGLDVHRVEAFDGQFAKYFGADGPHSYKDDGSVAHHYEWAEGPTLFDTKLSELPVVRRAQVGAILDDFDKAALAAGWVIAENYVKSSSEGYVYDIDDNTRFDTDKAGAQLNYEQLCAAYAAHSDLRCASSFMEGRVGDTPTRCSVGWSARYQCVCVYVYGDEETHIPKDRAPADPEKLAEALREVAAEHGVEIPPPEPNWRERYENGTVRASLHNARLAIEALGLVCSEDLFHHRLLIGRGEAAGLEVPPAYVGAVTDAAIGALRVKVSDVYGRDFTEKHIRDAVVTLAHENRFDPVLDMLAEAEAGWDGVPRLDRMAVEHFQCADTPYHGAAVRKTMIAAVARARVPGIKFDTIPVLEAPEGWNKSSAWLVLAGAENFSDESIIGKASREVQEALGAVWIHENAELAGMRKAEVETVKAFASRQVDRARPAYGHFLIEQARRSIEVGTTNSDEYLPSPTGNRRFWPLRLLRAINLTRLRRERLQLWGEAAAAQTAGESLVLDEALWLDAGAEQESRRTRHPWEALLAGLSGVTSVPELSGVGYLGNGVVHRADGEDRVSTAAIFEHVLEMPRGQLHIGHAKTLADVMRALGWRTGLFKIDGKVVRGYIRTVVTGNNT